MSNYPEHPMKRFKKMEPAFKMDYDDLERLIEDAFGHPYDFVADVEGRNYTWHIFDIREQDELDEGQLSYIQVFRATGESARYECMGELFLQFMADRNVIPYGHYCIHIFW